MIFHPTGKINEDVNCVFKRERWRDILLYRECCSDISLHHLFSHTQGRSHSIISILPFGLHFQSMEIIFVDK